MAPNLLDAPPFAGLETLLSPSGTGFAGTLPGAG